MNGTTTINIEAVFADIRKRRADATRRIAAEKGCSDFVAGVIYDSECAPNTTNAKMLAMIGVDPDTRHADLSDGAVATRLRTIIDGLSVWGIYLISTDHLTDRELLDRLRRILSDEVRLTTPDSMAEFIDLSVGAPKPPVTNRDSGLPRPVR